jgi:universal stress protein A
MRILLCVAGMPYAKATVSLGGTIAAVTQSSVTLLHVTGRRGDQMDGDRTLAAARDMLPGLTVDTRIGYGDAIKGILVEAKRGKHDLVIVGAYQGVGLTQQLLGSVAQKVARSVPTSVLVVRGHGLRLDRILICTAGMAVADPVIETGAQLAGAAHARATLLHVASPVPSMYTGLDDITETLAELLETDTPIARHLRHSAETLAQHQVAAELELRHGVASNEILREARQGDYDLVAIGASGTTGRLKEWLLGNVTRQIVGRAPCSVLVVKTKAPDA